MIWLIFITPLIFFVIDFIYFVFNGSRLSSFLRLPFEIISLIIFPCLFYYFIFGLQLHASSNHLSLIENIILYISLAIFVPCIVGYFISNYSSNTNSDLKASLLNLLTVIAIVLNVIIFIVIYIQSDIILPAIGNLPILLAFGITLIQNLQKQME